MMDVELHRKSSDGGTMVRRVTNVPRRDFDECQVEGILPIDPSGELDDSGFIDGRYGEA